MISRRNLIRWGVYILAFAATTILGLLVGAVIFQSPGKNTILDLQVASWVTSVRPDHPALTSVAKIVTRLGDFEIAGTIVAMIVVALLLAQRQGSSRVDAEEAPFWLIVAIGGQLMNWCIKGLIRRDRPPMEGRIVEADFYSFPSGHGTFAGVSLMLAAMVMIRIWREHSRTRIVVGIALATILAISVAASRVWLGVHYASDVIVGFSLGMIWAGLCHAIRFTRVAG